VSGLPGWPARSCRRCGSGTHRARHNRAASGRGDVRPPACQHDHPDHVAQLIERVGLLEQDPDLNVVVLDRANPDVYLTQYDVKDDLDKTAAPGAGPTGPWAWNDVLVRLARAPVISIASIRGLVLGAGSEFVLASTCGSPRARTRCSASSRSQPVRYPRAVCGPDSLRLVGRGARASSSRRRRSPTKRTRSSTGTSTD
jgi:hypothetical protein